jgi:hypothetical protein
MGKQQEKLHKVSECKSSKGQLSRSIEQLSQPAGKEKLTSSPSLRNLGAETYARLKTRSCPGLVTCERTTVSPDRTDFTRASKGMLAVEHKQSEKQLTNEKFVRREKAQMKGRKRGG